MTEIEPKVESTEQSLMKESDDVQISDILDALKKGWLPCAICVLMFTLGAVLYSLSLPNLYKSSVLLAPANNQSANVGGIGGQFGGIAALAGINLSGGGGNKTAEALEIIQSWAFIEDYINHSGIAPEIAAAVSWSKTSRQLLFDEKVFNSESREWKNDEDGESLKPTSWELYKIFDEALSLNLDTASGFVTLSIEHYSPDLAQKWVRQIVDKINLMLKMKAEDDAKRNIAFLRAQIEQTPIASMQTVLYSLIEEQIKSLMLATGSEEYVFRIISEPRIPERKSKPNRAIICIMGAIIGGIFGGILGLIYGTKKIRRGS